MWEAVCFPTILRKAILFRGKNKTTAGICPIRGSKSQFVRWDVWDEDVFREGVLVTTPRGKLPNYFCLKHTHMVHKKTIQYLLYTGLLASVIVGLGEYLLHFLPGGPGGEVSMLEHVPLDRASKGHFLAVFGAPLYFAGYYGLKLFFTRTSPTLANAIFILGVLAFSIGGVWISSRYFGAEVLQRSAGTADFAFYLQSYEEHYQVLVWALRIIIAALSVTYVMLVLKNKEGLPKWLAVFNPIILLLLILSSLIWFKPLGVHIAPIAMNVTHFIFFGVILIFLHKNDNHEVA